jgi:ribosome biogenesis GTPase / thiamine phosphate phosphatase
VARVDFGACVLLLEGGGLLRSVVRGRLMGPRKALGNAVVVGDLARYEAGAGPAEAETTAVVKAIEPRRNWFSRRASGKHAVEQIVAANLDQVVVVGSLVQPPFSAGLTDRVLCQAERSGLAGRIVLNKCDLDEAGDGEASARRILQDYERAGYPGHAVSARTGVGLEALRAGCLGKRSLFVGHSGVGKSTLLNALEPGLDLLAGRVNEKTGKGRHTTTAALLLRPEPGLELVDTPGVRSFGLWGIEPSDVDRFYPELRDAVGGCRFRDCEHEAEPGCAVREAVESGRVSRRRYESMRKLRQELRDEAASEAARAGRTGA